MRVHGLLSFPLTPFSDADEVDLSVFATHLEQQLAAGPNALFVACGTGEFAALSLEEHHELVRTAVRVVDGRLPVFAGAGGGPRVARSFAASAASAGADGLLLMPPYLVSSTPAGVVDHVRYVATDAQVPVVVYQRATALLDPAAAVALLDVPNVVGIKDGHGDVDTMLRMITAVRTSGHPNAEEFAFLNGLPTAELSAAAYRAIGVDGYSSAVLSFAPELATAFHRAVTAGNDEVVSTLLAEFYLPFAALRQQVPGYAVALVKAAARLSGLPVGPTRPPLVDPHEAHLRELAGILDNGRATVDKLIEEGRAA